MNKNKKEQSFLIKLSGELLTKMQDAKKNEGRSYIWQIRTALEKYYGLS